MLNKVFCFGILVSSVYFLFTSCRDERDHKNNDSKLKSTVAIVSSSQLHLSQTVGENILHDSSYGIFAESLKSTGLIETLKQQGPFTVFAPSNNAFRKLDSSLLESWKAERHEDFTNVLSNHIVAGSFGANEISAGQRLRTFAGNELIITKRNEHILVNGIKVTAQDVHTSNGIIYPIADLLFPQNKKRSSNQ